MMALQRGDFVGYVPLRRPIERLPSSQWFVVRSAIRREEKAKQEIKDLGFNALFPTFMTKGLRRGRRVELARPLFPSYLFAAFDPADQWGDIRRLKSVAEVLCGAGGIPLRVPDGIMATLLGALALGQFDELKRNKRLRPGDRVTIVRGPFAELVGKVKQAHSRQRIKVFLALFGGETVVDVPLQDLRIG